MRLALLILAAILLSGIALAFVAGIWRLGRDVTPAEANRLSRRIHHEPRRSYPSRIHDDDAPRPIGERGREIVARYHDPSWACPCDERPWCVPHAHMRNDDGPVLCNGHDHALRDRTLDPDGSEALRRYREQGQL